MNGFDLAMACISLIVIVLGLLYRKLRQSPFNEILVSTLLGVALSPSVFNVLDMKSWGNRDEIMTMCCRLTLAMALMATAFRIPGGYLKRNKKVQTLLLAPVMLCMFLSSAVIIHFVAGLEWPMSLLIGAVISPTDPVLAATIVTGEKAEQWLPQRIRDTISFESGANDGFAFPFVMFCLLLMQKQDGLLQEWIFKTLLWETAGAIVLGLAVGYLFGNVLRFSARKNFTANPAVLAFTLSVALFMLTVAELIHLNGVLAVFAAGLMLKSALSRQKDLEEEKIQEMMARLFTIPVFVFFGLILPWHSWLEMGWQALGIVVFVLLFRRLPFLLLCKPLLREFKAKDVAFMGWFGPVGGAALFYCFYVTQRLHLEEIWTITSLVVFSSVVVHGMTAYPFLKWYGKKI